MNALIVLGLFFPFLSFLILACFYQYLSREVTGWIACGSIFCSFICFVSLFFLYYNQDLETLNVTLFNWIHAKGVSADFSLTVDHLSLLMALIITGVGFLIHVYSVGYVEHETDFVRYFAFLNFFVFSMLLLVLASNLLLVFVGWEGVGLASYLLIGYWYTKDSAAKGAVKAFVVNRIGDLGFLLGLLLTFYLFGTTDIQKISEVATPSHLLTILTLLYFVGAIGKSAQLPLHVWLPDAMAGPTPVSALIHAATMVTAGVYLIVRLHVLYMLTPMTLQIVGIVGAVTTLYAACAATCQTDLKKVLAYSTVSQLGLMFLACGAGAFYSAMFHLTMHAFVKGLLFLSAGNVVHMLQGMTDMQKMGGLSKKFPVTHWLFLIGTLALAGVPPFAAFFSKDLILEQEYIAGYRTLFYIGLIASILTGFYLMRAYLLTFRGDLNRENQEAKEAPKVMLVPVLILAFLAITGGLLGATIYSMPILESYLSEIGISEAEKELSHGFIASKEAFMAIFGAFFGVLVPIFLYRQGKKVFTQPLQVLKEAFYIDPIYEWIFVKPLTWLSGLVGEVIEPKLFEKSIQVTGNSVNELGVVLQRVQNGQIRLYVAMMVMGFALLLFYFLI